MMKKNKSTAQRLMSMRFVIILMMALLGLTLAGGPLKIQGAEAVIALRSVSALSTATTGNITVAPPSPVVANDILILVVTTRNTTAVTLPSGFSSIRATSSGTGTTSVRQTSAYKRAIAGVDDQGLSYVVTHTGTVAKTAYIAAFSGAVLSGNPVNTSSQLATTSSNTVTGTAVSPTQAGTMLLFAGSHAYAGKTFTIGATNNTNPANNDTVQTGNGPGKAITGTTGTTSSGLTTFMYFGTKTTTGTSSNRTSTTTGTTARAVGHLVALIPDVAASTLTLANGTNPSASTIGAATSTNVDAFTLAVDAGSDTITTLPVVLSGTNGTSLASISITDSTGTITYYSAISNPTDGTLYFTGGTPIVANATATTFYIRITTKAATDLPAPPGQSYTVSAYATTTGLVSGAATKTGTDSGATITVDNLSPNDPTLFQGVPTSTQVALTWTNPTSGTFNNIMVIRNQWYCQVSTATNCITDADCGGETCVKTATLTAVPTEGSAYVVGNTVGSGVGRGTVIYSGTGTSYNDSGLFNGIGYDYKIFARDSYNNYSSGSLIGPISPMAPCQRQAPTIVMAPQTQTITTDGGFVQYAISITNNDINCDPATFNVTLSANSDEVNFDSSLDQPSVTLTSGGGSKNLYMTISALAGIKSGSNDNYATITDLSGNHSASLPANTLTATTTIARLSPKMHNSNNTGLDPAGGVTSNKWTSAGGWGIAGGQYGEFNCDTCHRPSTGNIKHIKETITAPDSSKGDFPIAGGPVRADSVMRKDSFYNYGWDSDSHTTSQRICEVCHSQTKYHNYDATRNFNSPGGTLKHNNDDDCIKCHSHDTAFNALSKPCDTCHGYPPPPLVLFGEKAPTLAPTVGQHEFHNQNLVFLGGGKVYGMTTTARTFNACNTCHYRAVATSFNDNHNVTMGFWIYGKDADGNGGKGMDGEGFRGGVYDGWTSVTYDSSDPWTSVGNPYYTTVMNTANDSSNYMMMCSNVYCHGGTMGNNGGERTSAFWAKPADTQCKTCHGATSDDPPRKGEHERHTSWLYNNQPCKDCHNGYWWGTTIPSNTPTHVDGEINFAWDTGQSYISNSAVYMPGPDDTANGRGGWITAGLVNSHNNALLQPNKIPYTKTYGTCSSLGNCHPGGSPVWGTGSLTNSCDTCHADMGAGTDATHSYTGSHDGPSGGKHTGAYMIACEACHAKLDPNNKTSHAKGFVSSIQAAEVLFTNLWGTKQYVTARDNPADASWFVYRNLQGNPYGWSTGFNWLTFAGSGVIPPPAYTGRSTRAGTDPIDSNFSYTSGTCTNVWCHSNANPIGSWNTFKSVQWQSTAGAGSLACNGCHTSTSDNGTSTRRSWSTAHNRHVNIYPYTCDKCHYSVVTVASVSTINNYANHVNGVKDVVFNPAAGSGGTYSSPACANTYCHADGTSVATGAAPQHNAVTWNIASGAAGTTCDSCHGGPSGLNDLSGRPAYEDSVKPNEHTSLPGSKVVRHNAMPCQECHYNVARATYDTINDYWTNTINTYANHANGVYDLQGRTGQMWQSLQYTYASDGGTCTVYCHSNIQSQNGVAGPDRYDAVKWGDSASSDCNTKCHLGNNMTSGGHTQHLARMSTSLCDACHSSGGSGTDQHANGVIKVNFALGGSYTQDGTAPGFWATAAGVGAGNGYGQCSNIACHGAGNSGTPTWGATIGCQDCHMSTSPDVDDFWGSFWYNGTPSMRNQAQWLNTGHGKTSGTYTSGNPAANFVDWGSTNGSYVSQCEYCHDKTVGHRDTADMNNLFRLKNVTNPTWGLNYNCQVCHATGGAGVNIGYGFKTATKKVDSTHHGYKHTDWGTASGGDGSTTLTDTTKNWAVNQWRNATVAITGGTGSGQSSMVQSNTATTLTVDTPWIAQPDVDSSYTINEGTIGDTGTASGGAATSLTDGTKTWMTNRWNNASLSITTGTGSGQTLTILSNDSNVINVVSSWSTMPDVTSSYSILLGNGGKICWDCHDPHGDANIYMMHNSVAKTTNLTSGVPINSVPVTFTAHATGTDYAQNSTTATGICNVCHTTAKHFTATSGDSHNSTAVCTGCHMHSGSTTTDAFKGTAVCSGCHDYDTRNGGITWGRNVLSVEGFGVHAVHIEHLKTTSSTILNGATDSFGGTNYNNVCGVCHTQNSTYHSMDYTTNVRTINFNGSTTYQFGPNPPVYSGVTGVSSATTPKTCSNLSCHYSTTPVWSGY